MCGIIGIHNSPTAVRADTLKRGADALAHRGPDGEGFWIATDNRTALAHRRLSIIDLSTGAQPLTNESGNIHAVVNGEFYGHDAIRRDLQTRGHVFKTLSDSEILIHLYEEYGTACLEHLRGEFAFILWDGTRRRLFAARDRFGIKPLCYTRQNGCLMLASEAKALFALGVRAAWDTESFHTSTQMQYTLPDRTLFKDILQLKPGHMLVASGDDIKTVAYWDMDFAAEVPQALSDDDAAEEIADALTEAVRVRLCADVPVCAHLSGGLDSSAILGLATHITGKPLDAFTVSFDHDGYDEYAIAAETAAQFGTRLHNVAVTQDDLVEELPNAVYHGEGLAINGHLAAKYILNRHIRAAGFKVALSGEGSDEIFAGYPHLRQDLFRADTANDAARAVQTTALYAGNAASAGLQLAYGDTLPTDAVSAQLGFVPSFIEAKASLGYRMAAVLDHSFSRAHQHHDAYAQLMQDTPVAQQLRGRHPVNQSAWLWSKTALANYILRTLGDGMEMAQSVEGRLPFLDHHLFATVRRLPVGMKIRGTVEKFILREAVRPHITETVYRRQKHPFLAPPVSRFGSSRLAGMIADHINSASFAAMPFFDVGKTRKMVDSLPTLDATAQTAAEPVLMTMLTAHVLHEKFGLSA